MANDTTNELTTSPQLVEAQDELSLHFGFPTIQSRMLKAEPERLILDYTRTMMGFLLFQPQPERIAMIGLGGGSLAKYCRRHLPDAEFTAIEISPDVVMLSLPKTMRLRSIVRMRAGCTMKERWMRMNCWGGSISSMARMVMCDMMGCGSFCRCILR